MVKNYVQNLNNQGDLIAEIGLRPTLFVGLGGFGCSLLRTLKKRIAAARPADIDGFGFLGLDTQARPNADILTGNEYVPLSLGVNPKRIAKEFPDRLDWYTKLIGSFPTRNITSGADKTRATGRLAFCNPPTIQAFMTKLSRTLERLQGVREHFVPGMAIKTYIVSTLAGGTGSGCLLDVMVVLSRCIEERVGADAMIQAILITPEHLLTDAPPAHMPDFRANTYAGLKEIHHILASDDHPLVGYDDAGLNRVALSADDLPGVIHLIGNTNENGDVIADNGEQLVHIIVSYLMSEIHTPIDPTAGQPRVQDEENALLGLPGRGNLPRAFASFGVTTIGLPIDLVERFFSLKLIGSALEAELTMPKEMAATVSIWLDSLSLKEAGVDQLQDMLKRACGSDLLKIAVDARGTVLAKGVKDNKVVATWDKFHADTVSQFDKEKKVAIQKQTAAVSAKLVETLRQKLDTLFREATVGEAACFLDHLEKSLLVHQTALGAELDDGLTRLSNLEKDLADAKPGLEAALHGFWGRRGRLEDEVDDLEARLELLLNRKIDVWIKQEANSVYAALLNLCRTTAAPWQKVSTALSGRASYVSSEVVSLALTIDQHADIGHVGFGNRFSLLNASQAQDLYAETIEPDRPGAVARLRAACLDQELLTDVKSSVDQWIAKLLPWVIEHEIKNRLANFDLIEILNRFYPKDKDLLKISQNIRTLSSPLFHLNQDRIETDYDRYWIIAVHPDLKDGFVQRLDQYLEGSGRSFAVSESPFEAIIYQLKFGYTIFSLAELTRFQSAYQRGLKAYREGRAEKRPVRPVHAWAEADQWEELVPNQGAEEAVRWFILGRAFSQLFPSPEAASPTDKKNTAFLYARGNNYYLQVDIAKHETVGKGLADAFRNFSENIEWQKVLRKRIEAKKGEVGDLVALKRLREEYLPKLSEDIETASNGLDSEREALLRKFDKALTGYLQEEEGRLRSHI